MLMYYIKKSCPICGNEFTILNTAEEKAIYCTIKCLSDSLKKEKSSEYSALFV